MSGPVSLRKTVAVLAVTGAAIAGVSLLATNVVCACATPAPEAAAWPAVTGNVSIGETLSTTNGTWVASGNLAGHTNSGYTYQWLQCDTSGGSCTNATGTGATTSSYTIASGDSGHTLRARVTATNDGGSTAQNSAATVTVPGADVTAFADAMDGSSIAQGPNQWTVTDNTIGNSNTYQCDSASNTAETGGYLTESITNGSYTCPGAAYGPGITCPGNTCSSSWRGAEVHARDQGFQYGTVSVTAKTIGQSTGSGWPAIWLLGTYCQHPQYLVAGADPAPCAWPDVGSEEVDIEDWYGGNLSTTHANMYDAATGGNGTTCQTGSISPAANSGYHTYSMVWTASSLIIKVDGTTHCTFNSQLPVSPMFVILTAQMAQNTGTPSPATQYFQNMTVTPNGPNVTSSANWPSISGSTVHGNVLTADHGTWTGSPTAYHYQWLQCNSSGNYCGVITTGSCSSTWMACGSTYTTVAGDVGHKIQVLVQADNSSGKTQYGSNTTAAVS